MRKKKTSGDSCCVSLDDALISSFFWSGAAQAQLLFDNAAQPLFIGYKITKQPHKPQHGFRNKIAHLYLVQIPARPSQFQSSTPPPVHHSIQCLCT